jgi:hypothetical protein
MPFCPSCGAEFVPGRVICPDCHISLTEEPLPVPEVEQVKWEKVIGVENQVAGVMLTGVLQSAEIPVYLEERTIPAYGAVPSSWSEDSWGDLYVPHEYFDTASDLVADYLAQVALSSDPESEI